MGDTRLARVLIIQSVMKHYRLPFFLRLQESLAREQIELTVAYSAPNAAHAARKDDAELPSDWGLKVKGYWLFGRFLYQPLWRHILKADLVIVGPEIKYLINPLLLVMSALRVKRVAFWGLGPNMHPDRSPIAEWIKNRLFTKVDWWFAYTATIARYLERKGMAPDQITTVQNATDTTELRRLMNDIPDTEVATAKLALTNGEPARIALYCGMMQKIKSIPLLIETTRQVRKMCPSFHLVMIGNGPERGWLEAEIVNEPWIHYLGSKFGRDSAIYYKMADIFIIGGTVGLSVVDSFAAGLPLLATNLDTHPPEISYVKDGYNGRLSPHDPKAFAESIVTTLSDAALLATLRAGAQASGETYTIETMVHNFADGIGACLRRYGFTMAGDTQEYGSQRV